MTQPAHWGAAVIVLHWLGAVAIASLLWSLVLAGSHQNDVRLAVQTFWNRRLALTWMIRLRAAGTPVSWEWVLVTYLLTVLAMAWIWAGPGRKNCGKVDGAKG